MYFWSFAANDSLYKFRSCFAMLLAKLEIAYVHPSSIVFSIASETVEMCVLYLIQGGKDL